jgi:glucan 1,3-beta-glucosidase
LVDRYAGHPAVLGVEPVNEPWELTPIEALKSYYWDAYLIVKRKAPYWKFIMHDSFRFTPEVSHNIHFKSEIIGVFQPV